MVGQAFPTDLIRQPDISVLLDDRVKSGDFLNAWELLWIDRVAIIDGIFREQKLSHFYFNLCCRVKCSTKLTYLA